MITQDKWRFLSLGAHWDRSIVPIYEATAGRETVPLLKTLLTNNCRNDCLYCAFRAGRRCPRESWKTDELAKVTMYLWNEGRITGLFLSSSVSKDPDYIIERELSVVRTLRGFGYTGYVHLRMMPGVSRHYIREAVELADRVGVNLEAPNPYLFSELCPDKGGFEEAIIKRLEWIVEEVEKARTRNPNAKFGFGRSGVDTQMIVGAVEDNDLLYLKASEWLYKDLGLRRVYYSGFEPVEQTPLEAKHPCPPYREYRLYQCSFLLRDYGFEVEDLAQILDDDGFLLNIDPKLAFARKNPDIFPIDLNTAGYYEIIKIPGIGPERARRIIKARNEIRFRYISGLEGVLGPDLARTVAPYIILKNKRLTYFTK